MIFSASGNKIQANWVREIEPKKHSLYVGVSSTGWTNDDLGVEWLKKVFDLPYQAESSEKVQIIDP